MTEQSENLIDVREEESAATESEEIEETTVAEQAEIAEETATTEEAEAPQAQQQPIPDPYENLSAREKKTVALKYIALAAITLAGIYLSQLFRFTMPLFAHVMRGALSTMFFNIFGCVFLIGVTVAMFFAIKKFTDCKMFTNKTPKLDLKTSLIIYACVIVSIVIISAALGFKVKVMDDIGSKVAAPQIMTAVTMYAYGAVKLILTYFIIRLVQEAGELLYTGKYCKWIPWGGIAVALTCGLLDVLVAYLTGGKILLTWLFVIFHLLYGVIYLLGKKSFFVTYLTSIIIYIL